MIGLLSLLKGSTEETKKITEEHGREDRGIDGGEGKGIKNKRKNVKC